MRRFLVIATLIMTGCGVSTKTPAQINESMTAKPWSVWVHSTEDPNVVTVHGALSAGACVSVEGPVCFTGSGLSNTSDDPTPTAVSLMIGVPVDPVPLGGLDGYAFNFQYVYQTAGVTSTITGAGRFYPNGNVSGTWQCTGGCAGASGAFAASQ